MLLLFLQAVGYINVLSNLHVNITESLSSRAELNRKEFEYVRFHSFYLLNLELLLLILYKVLTKKIKMYWWTS